MVLVGLAAIARELGFLGRQGNTSHV